MIFKIAQRYFPKGKGLQDPSTAAAIIRESHLFVSTHISAREGFGGMGSLPAVGLLPAEEGANASLRRPNGRPQYLGKCKPNG